LPFSCIFHQARTQTEGQTAGKVVSNK